MALCGLNIISDEYIANVMSDGIGEDEAAIADSTTGPYLTEDFLSGFRIEPPLGCVRNSDCPGNSSCQTRAPTGPQHSGSVQTTYCGGRGRPADLLVLTDGSMLVRLLPTIDQSFA
jgi:hypothetical protein